jgi:hypothetical protein
MTLMNQILKNYIEVFCVVYLYDILIYSCTIEEHLDHLKKIFDILLANKLYAKLNKCEFLQKNSSSWDIFLVIKVETLTLKRSKPFTIGCFLGTFIN